MSLNIINTVQNVAYRGLMKTKKYSPELCIAAAVITGIAGTVMACKATLKAAPLVEEVNSNLEIARSIEEKDERSRKITKIYANASIDLAKMYAPSVVLNGASLCCVVASRNILTKRNTAIMGAYAALNEAYRAYQKNVAELYGEDEERKIRHQINEKSDTNELAIYENAFVGTGDYYFDDKTAPIVWRPSAEYNLTSIASVERWANEVLKVRRVVVINDILKELSMETDSFGAINGWHYQPDEHPEGHISITILDANTGLEIDRRDPSSTCYLLEFNYEGCVLNYW